MIVTDSELSALLDAHDALVKSCVDSVLPFVEFSALYNDFLTHMRLTVIRRRRMSVPFCSEIENESRFITKLAVYCRGCVQRRTLRIVSMVTLGVSVRRWG
jgi:hypothetical protein